MLSTKIKYYLSSIRNKGLIETIRQVSVDYYYNKKLGKYHFIFSEPDLYILGETENKEVARKAKGGDPTIDSPTSSYFAFKFLRKTDLPKSEINLLDLGCGSGKILVTGMLLNFKKVTGVDLSNESLKRARENCVKAEISSATKYEIINYDAGEYPIPEDVNVIFMYNPFYGTTMKSVVNNIIRSYNVRKRSIYIIYHGPLFSQLFDAEPVFTRFYSHTSNSGKITVIIYKTV